jgi:hypothetical protein
MEPAPTVGQEVHFKNGTPMVFSRGPRFDVVVSPRAGPTGRYELSDRVGLMVGVHNHGVQQIEVSEANLSATGNQSPARVLRAWEIEDAIITDAKWALFQNAVAGGLQQMSTQNEVLAHHLEHDAADNAQAIRANRQAALAQVATVFQRNTIDAGDSYLGAVIIELSRKEACGVRPYRDDRREIVKGGPCRFRVSVNVDGEVHAFEFGEFVN